jgi:hypothetical protein
MGPQCLMKKTEPETPAAGQLLGGSIPPASRVTTRWCLARALSISIPEGSSLIRIMRLLGFLGPPGGRGIG